MDAFEREASGFLDLPAAARLESSKIFAKDFMRRHGIPTAEGSEFVNSMKAHEWCRAAKYPLVVKADGLALGKVWSWPKTPSRQRWRFIVPWSCACSAKLAEKSSSRNVCAASNVQFTRWWMVRTTLSSRSPGTISARSMETKVPIPGAWERSLHLEL